MVDVKTFPIVIISSPRTGSTPLAYELKNKYNIELFNEPLNKTSGGKFNHIELNRFLEFIKKNDNNFILKVHINDLHKYPDDILKIVDNYQCSLIRIRRRDIVSQIASLYIETNRDLWGYYKDFLTSEMIYQFTNSEIPIRLDLVKSIKRVSRINDELNNLTYRFDHDIWYEDLVFKDNTFITTPKPNNYKLIQEKVRFLIEEGILK